MAGEDQEVAVSVVVPLIRAREVELEGLEAWARQTLPAGAVEIVAVSGGVPDTEAAAQAILRRGDRLVVVPGMDEPGLWDAGARAARGRVLILTEGHTIPRPGCVAAAVDALDDGLDVAGLESRAPQHTAAAWLEDAVFQDLFERRIDAGDPRALSLRGIALASEMYRRSGGLSRDVNASFAERLLAARLAGAGARIGRARGAVIDHFPNSRFRELREASVNFCRGEIAARLAAPAGEIDPELHLERSPVWDRRARFDPALNRAALPGLVGLALRSGPAGRAARRALPGTIVRSAAGPRPAAWSADLRSRLSAAMLAVSWRLGHRPETPSLWAGVARASMLRAMSERSRTGLWRGPLQLPTSGEEITADRLAEHAVGLHPPEAFRGQRFRWTEPVVVLDLVLPAGAGELVVSLADARPLGDGQLIASWGRPRVRPRALRVRGSSLTVEVPAGTCGPLTLALPAMRARDDPRRLGLPLVAVAAR